MQVTVETISSRLCTVIRTPFDADSVRQSLMIGVPVVATDIVGDQWVLLSVSDDGYYTTAAYGGRCQAHHMVHTITTLPPLPKRPTSEDAGLLLKYLAEGLYPVANDAEGDSVTIRGCHNNYVMVGFYIKGYRGEELGTCDFSDIEITHAVLANGERVEIAIEGVS